MMTSRSFFRRLAAHRIARRSFATAFAIMIGVVASNLALSQSLSVYERVRFDIGSTANSANPQYIGSNPMAIAWSGTQLYVAGFNSSASTINTAITQITNPNATPGLNVVPTFASSFGVLSTNASRGYTGLALTGGKLGAAWDNGAVSPNAIQGFDTSSNAVLWNLSASGTTTTNVGTSRGMAGIGVDPGYQGDPSQGGGGFAWTTQGSGRRAENDPATGVPTYVLSGNATPANPSSVGGMILSSSSTLWRDITFDPASGDLYARNNNNVTMNVRTGSNSCVAGINIISGTLITTPANNVGTNIEFLSGIASQGGDSYAGNALIFNDRTSNASGQAWTSVIKITTTGSTTVSQIPTNWNMLYGSSVNGSSVYDFGWDATTQTLAVMDYTNRTVSIFDLNVNVQTVASGTQTASLSGTTPLAKQGAGTLVADQAGAIATNTVYVEQGTLQIGSGGTSGVIGSPVAVTVSSGATLAFNRSDSYGGSIGNTIGGAGGVELTSGALTLTAANAYTGGTLISGGTFSVGAGSTTGSITGNVVNNGALVFNRSNATSLTGVISGTGSVTITGGGSVSLSGDNTYSGPTNVAAGTLFVNGAATGSGAVAVASAATLAGTGTVGGATTFQTGATLAPGLSLGVGTLSFNGGVTWNTGANYNWQLFDATGTAGDIAGWDLAAIGGGLTIAASSSDPFKINLWTLSGTGPFVSGSAANFDPAQNYTWKIASASGGITGFAANKFVINTSATNGTGGFANDFSGGTFSVAQSGNDLNLVYSVGGPSVITIDVASGTQTQTQAGYPTLSGSIPVVKTGAGTLVITAANTLTGSTTVQQGTLQLANGSALASSTIVPVAGGNVSLTPYLQTTVGGLAPNAGGLVDVGSGYVTVASGLSPTDLVTAIVAGRGDGSWTGASGITSSVAAADVAVSIPRSVGWVDNGDGSVSFAFAAPGDTNIDWQVDVLDAGNFLSFGKFDTGLAATWLEGDFNYDGVVDVLDAADFFGTGLYDAGTYNPPAGAAGAVAAVPEPSGLALLACLGGMAVAAFRRRRTA